MLITYAYKEKSEETGVIVKLMGRVEGVVVSAKTDVTQGSHSHDLGSHLCNL